MNIFIVLKNKHKIKICGWIAYIAALLIAIIHVIPQEYILKTIAAIIPISILVLFAQVIASNMKYNIKDIAITLFGICYIVIFLMYIPIIRETANGRITIWYVFLAAWGTDIFAYSIGKRFGKHKFSKISPKKSVEGCLAGTISGVVLVLITTVIYNQVFDLQINYLIIGIIGLVINLLGQIGDFSASCIKRYSEVKDFSNLL